MSSMWADEQRFAVAPDVVSRVLDGEAVLLDLAAESYFGLNAVGTQVWHHLAAGKTYGEMRAALLEGGMPCTPTDLTARFERHVAALSKGKDAAKVRILLE